MCTCENRSKEKKFAKLGSLQKFVKCKRKGFPFIFSGLLLHFLFRICEDNVFAAFKKLSPDRVFFASSEKSNKSRALKRFWNMNVGKLSHILTSGRERKSLCESFFPSTVHNLSNRSEERKRGETTTI